MQVCDLSGRLLWQLPRQPQSELAAATITTSRRGLVAGSEAALRAWDWNGNPLAEAKPQTMPVGLIEASPADDTVVIIDEKGRAVVLDERFNQTAEIDAGVINPAPDGGWGSVRFDTGYQVRFSPDGARLVVLGPANLSMWSRDGRKLWDVAIDPLDGAPLEVSRDRVLVAVCTKRGRGASLGSLRMCYDSTAMLWNFSGKVVRRLDAGQADETIVHAAAFNRLGNRVATVNRDGSTQLWDADGNAIANLLLRVDTAHFDTKGGRLVTVADGGAVHVWEVWDDLDMMIAEAERRSRRLQTATAAPK